MKPSMHKTNINTSKDTGDGSQPGYFCTVQRAKMGINTSKDTGDGSQPGYFCTVQRL